MYLYCFVLEIWSFANSHGLNLKSIVQLSVFFLVARAMPPKGVVKGDFGKGDFSKDFGKGDFKDLSAVDEDLPLIALGTSSSSSGKVEKKKVEMEKKKEEMEKKKAEMEKKKVEKKAEKEKVALKRKYDGWGIGDELGE